MMLIIKRTAEENGAYQNQYSEQAFANIPEGWVEVPTALVEQTIPMLPWIVVEFDTAGNIIGIAQGVVPPYEPPQPEPSGEQFSEYEVSFLKGVVSGLTGGANE